MAAEEQSFAVAGSQEVTIGERAEVQALVALFEKDSESTTHKRLKVWSLLSAGAAAGS